MTTERCSICHKPVHAKNLCFKHYMNKRYQVNPHARLKQIKASNNWQQNHPIQRIVTMIRFLKKHPNYYKLYWQDNKERETIRNHKNYLKRLQL
jgi:hypothetical protein